MSLGQLTRSDAGVHTCSVGNTDNFIYVTKNIDVTVKVRCNYKYIYIYNYMCDVAVRL